jgi:type I restriction enzyme S subunit
VPEGVLLDLPIPEIAPDEQSVIADMLETIHAAAAAEMSAEQNASALKSAAMNALFTRGLRGEPQKDTEIGPVPESWEATNLGWISEQQCGRIQTGPFGSQLHANEYQMTGTPVINPTHLSVNRINHENVPRVSEDTALRLQRHKVDAGDILFGRRGEIGRHGLVSEDEAGWLCGTGCFLVRVRYPGLQNKFLSYLFSTEGVLTWLAANAAGAIMPNLNNTVLSRLPVVYPSIEEQLEIVTILDAIDRKIDLHRQKRVVLEELFKSLLHKLMTGAIRVDDLDLSALRMFTTNGEETA